MRRSEIPKGLVVAVMTLLVLVQAAAQEDLGIEYDDEGKLVSLDYPGMEDDAVYEYYPGSDNVKKVIVGRGLMVYEFDESGNLLSETYEFDPELDRAYAYYEDGLLKSISSSKSSIMFTYDSENRINGKYTQVGDMTLYELYSYYSDGRIRKVENPQGYREYEYDGEGNIVTERSTDIIYGGEYSTEVYYEYDENSNIVKMSDSDGREVHYEYEAIPYDCSITDCVDDECTDIEVLEEKTCYYYSLSSRTVGNNRVEIGDSAGNRVYNSGFGDYIPLEEYDSDGNLIEDESYTYEYRDGYYLATDKLTGETIKYIQDASGINERAEYSSGEVEEYIYDPLGELIAVEYTYPSDDGIEKLTYYLAEPGDMGSFIAEADLASRLEGINVPEIGIIGPPRPPTDGDGERQAEAEQPDYLLWAIIGIVVLIIALVAHSKVKGGRRYE